MSTKKETEQDLKAALNHISNLLQMCNKNSHTAKNAQLFFDTKTKCPAFQFIKKGYSWFTSKGVQ